MESISCCWNRTINFVKLYLLEKAATVLSGMKRSSEDMSKVKVNVKWGKESFNDIEVDLSEPPMVFKSQLFALSAVPPNRQKVMIKGGLLKDDDWGKQTVKEGATVMLMGSADAKLVEAPNDIVFVEDLPEHEQVNLETKQYGCGLENLGNTCYMNSTLQCLYAIEPLRQRLILESPTGLDQSSKLAKATHGLFVDIKRGGEAFPPYSFLMALREKFPQFAQQGQHGFMQQDAEECWSSLVYTLREKLLSPENVPVVDKLMGINSRLKLTCEESGEELEVECPRSYMLKCNIDGAVNHLHEGISLGLKDDRERHSEKLGKTALFRGTSTITELPEYLTVQMMRFFYKAQVQQKAKIMRKCSYTIELDTYEFCSAELKQQLDGPRAALKAHQDWLLDQKKIKKPLDNGPSGTTPTPAVGDTDIQMKDSTADHSAPTTSFVGARTGKYELIGCLTHKGRSADSGHYVSWVKQRDGIWVLFDDDKLSFKKDEDILALCGGGDWHMAYLLLYRAVTVPAQDS